MSHLGFLRRSTQFKIGQNKMSHYFKVVKAQATEF